MKSITECSICVLTYNRCEQVIKTLERIKLEFIDEQQPVFVLDNGSNDGTYACLLNISHSWPSLTVIYSSENVGCAKGREKLWRMTDSKYILSIDDDILLHRDDVVTLMRYIKSNDNIGLVSPIIIDSISRRILNPVSIDINNAKSFFEACFLLKSAVLPIVGFFDPMLTAAGEGLDFTMRLQKAGFSIRRAPDVVVEHVDRVRTESEVAERRRRWLWSFCYLYWKNTKPALATWLSARIFLSHVRSGWKLLGIKFVLTLPKEAISGARFGRKMRIR